jgi:hypothetical protein
MIGGNPYKRNNTQHFFHSLRRPRLDGPDLLRFRIL